MSLLVRALVPLSAATEDMITDAINDSLDNGTDGGMDGDGEDGENGPKDLSFFAHLMFVISRAALIVFGLLFGLRILGVDTSSLVAGLGVGGLTVGLALQTTLKDLFGTFALLADPPFHIGDFIDTGDCMTEGFVEQVGLRSTRIKTLDAGHILHIPNSQLATSKIKNATEMRERRVKFMLKLSKDTATKHLRTFKNVVQDIISRTPLARYSDCALAEIADSGFIWHIIWYCESRHTDDSRAAQHAINIDLLEYLDSINVSLGASAVNHNFAYDAVHNANNHNSTINAGAKTNNNNNNSAGGFSAGGDTTGSAAVPPAENGPGESKEGGDGGSSAVAATPAASAPAATAAPASGDTVAADAAVAAQGKKVRAS